jgi:hypothetical protein
MAKRRMLLGDIIFTDDFTELPHSAQALYMHLNLNADDDGFVGGTSGILKKLSVSRRELQLLRKHGYVTVFSSGVVLINHWLLHNQIRQDRYTPTRFVEELSNVELSVNKTYKIKESSHKSGAKRLSECQPNDNQMTPQVSVEKVNKEKKSLNKSMQEKMNRVEGRKNGSEERFDVDNSDEGCEDGEFPPKQESFLERLSDEQKKKYRAFINELTLHFMKEYGSVDVSRFIKYNEQRLWIGRDGESVIDNYQKYAAEWMKKEFYYA